MADVATTDQELRKQAIKSIKRKKEFKTSVAAYVIVNAFLIALWAITDVHSYFWPAWVLAGWGIGLAFQGWGAYGRPSKAITESEIEKETQRLKDG